MLTAYSILAAYGMAMNADAAGQDDPAHRFLVNGIKRLVREAREQWPDREGGFVLKLQEFVVADEEQTH